MDDSGSGKVLHLIRHAKSSWDDPVLSDIDRPLNKRGKKARYTMAEYINSGGAFEFPEDIYSSPATRAQQTVEGILDALSLNQNWQTVSDLYTFDGREVIRFCKSLTNDKPCATIIGHNPALHDVVEFLTGETIEKFPTCAYAKLKCNIADWQNLKSNCANLEVFYFPRMF